MKRIIFLAVLSCFIPATSWALPVTVSFDPQDSIVHVGDTFTVDLMADIPEPVLGWGLDVSFDSGILTQVAPPTIGSVWVSAPTMDGDGLAGIAFPLSVFGNDVLLATLTFEATALGISPLQASYTALDKTEGFPLAFALPGSFADVEFVDGSVSVVPEPATVLLVGAGLIGLAGLRKKFRTT